MSLITKTFKPKAVLQSIRSLNVASTKQCHWFPDYKPGPYPKTKEEREAAAKKYNLLPEEYEPYPDDGFGLGDYPKLPFDSVDSKDHNEIYDNPILRRNYLEPLPKEQIILFPEMLSTAKSPVSHKEAVFNFLSFIIVGATIFYFLQKIRVHAPLMERQYPTEGVDHYTFELDHERKYQRKIPVKVQETPVIVEKVEPVETEEKAEEPTEAPICIPKKKRR